MFSDAGALKLREVGPRNVSVSSFADILRDAAGKRTQSDGVVTERELSRRAARFIRPRWSARGLGVARVGLVLMFLLAACGCGSAQKQEPMSTIRFGVLQSVDQLPLFVMEERGFARRHGIKLIERVHASGNEVIAEMGAGHLDGGYPGSVPMLVAARQGVVPERVLGVGAVAFADADSRVLAVLVGRDVRGWKDLAGRAIAVNDPDAIGGVAIRLRLKAEGVTGSRLVSIAFPNQGLAVAGGNVAAAVMVEPYIAQSVSRGDGRVLDWIVGGGEPFPSFQETLIAFRTAFVRRRPEVVTAFLAAQLEAVRWIVANEGEARAILARRLGLTSKVGRDLVLPRFPLDARDDPELLGEMQDKLRGVEPGQVVSVRALYDESFLDRASGR